MTPALDAVVARRTEAPSRAPMIGDERGIEARGDLVAHLGGREQLPWHEQAPRGHGHHFDEARRRTRFPSEDAQLGELVIGSGYVEAEPEPAPVTDVRRSEEPVRILPDQLPLGAVRDPTPVTAAATRRRGRGPATGRDVGAGAGP